MEKIEKVMSNVMAALNTFGVEFDTNEWCGVRLHKSPKEVREKARVILCYDRDLNFESFVGFKGSAWAEEGDEVIILFHKVCLLTKEEQEEYASSLGCASYMEACVNYGDPVLEGEFLAVKIPKGKDKISSFVRKIAKFCWA